MTKEPILDSLNPFPERDGETDREAQIRRRAYEIWEAAGRPEGREHEHWFAAESEFAERQDMASGITSTPIGSGINVPGLRTTDAEGLGSDKSNAPKTAGASKPAPDTSRNPVANRDRNGPRRAGTTPRPTHKPLA
jgi:hypothetical protein